MNISLNDSISKPKYNRLWPNHHVCSLHINNNPSLTLIDRAHAARIDFRPRIPCSQLARWGHDNASMDACPGAFGTGTGGFHPCRTRITVPKLLNMRLFSPFLRLCTVSENEVSSETMVSAVIVLSSGYRNLTMGIQNRARNEIRTRPGRRRGPRP